VEPLMMLALLGSTFLIAFASAKGTLSLIFHFMSGKPLPFVMHWKPLFFVVALFWCWYLAPSVLESRGLARFVVFLAP
jgi:hypothetical protein